jgi:maleate cis-trans isomerase
MYGWRKRIGYISPSVLEITSHDFNQIAPEGIGMVGMSSNIPHWSPDNFEKAVAQIEEDARYLKNRLVDYIIYAGVPVVTTRGKGADRDLIARLTAASGKPATTSIRSALDAMHHMGMKRIAIASPYPAALQSTVVAFVKTEGIEILHETSMDVPFLTLHAVPPYQIYQFALQVIAANPDADGLYIPCPQWQVAEIVDMLERDSGKPVVAGDPADFWAAFKALGIRDRIEGYGKLLESLSA